MFSSMFFKLHDLNEDMKTLNGKDILVIVPKEEDEDDDDEDDDDEDED